MSAKKICKDWLSQSGIKINGSRDFDIQVHNEKLYKEIFARGSLGLGEAYMKGWWSCEKLDVFFYKVLRANIDSKVKINFNILSNFLVAKLTNPQTKSKSFKVGEVHYDVGNDLYSRMLDKRMVYTCAYWKASKTLDKAQEAKLDLVCKKLRLKKGQKILDIGCGWGSFAKFAANKYGVKVVGVTISKEQIKLAREKCKGLPVTIRLQDYRELNEKFDHIVSLGMFEHVGPKNYEVYFEVVSKCLKDGGLFLLHTIGRDQSSSGTDPWINKYIFPGGVIPSVKQISKSMEGFFVMEDWHNFGTDYDKTLMAWFKNFDNAWKKDLSEKYGETSYMMWKYYLLSCAGAFRARSISLWQIVLSKNGVEGGYESVR